MAGIDLDRTRPRSIPAACARVDDARPVRSPTASSSRCSARPAAARRRCCARSPGLEAPPAGRSCIGDRDVTPLPPGERDVAMVFQDYALFPHMDVADNIAYPLRIQRSPRRERAREGRARPAAGSAWTALMERRPGQLSGGQQQRVALARAVAYAADGVPVRRATVQPGRPAAAGGAHVPQAAAARARRHDRVRHPRPGRGAGAGRPDRGDGGRPASGRSARPREVFQPPGQHVRRQLHRLDADEPGPWQAPSVAPWSPRGTTAGRGPAGVPTLDGPGRAGALAAR